ncbi:uncharacterized protein LOC143188603 [Calliopsis andreniformis]|uniref:uncharacterized protein LOC143188603 n=1 Tax=Calliopsis andreniformis TaxID=337506 RepID=UPI003FCC826D
MERRTNSRESVSPTRHEDNKFYLNQRLNFVKGSISTVYTLSYDMARGSITQFIFFDFFMRDIKTITQSKVHSLKSGRIFCVKLPAEKSFVWKFTRQRKYLE